MTIDALLVLQRSDVVHLSTHAERYDDMPMLIVDPGILDAVVAAGFRRYEFRRIDPGADLVPSVYAEALSRAARIDQQLTRVRSELLGPGIWTGWDQSLFYLFFQRALTTERIGQACADTFPEARLGLLRPDNPQLFNLDSFLSPAIVSGDSARWHVVDRYEAGRSWNPLMLQMCFDFAGVAALAAQGNAQALTHIPTCFYDGKVFEEAVVRRFERSIDLPGVYCDVPVRRVAPLVRLLETLPPQWRPPICEIYAERARQHFEAELSTLVPHRPALQAQALALARRSLIQVVNFMGLRQALAGNRPHFVVCDHDTGNNGPLFSLAAELGSAVTVLPHSAYPTSAQPHGERVEVVELPGFGTPVRTVLGQPIAKRAVAFRARAPAVERRRVRRLCLLLNTMQSDGISHIDLYGLIRFHKALERLCQRHAVELAVRLKPSTPALNVVASVLGRPAAYFMQTMAQPMGQLAAEADVCVAWGEPTSGTLGFLDAASLVLHVSEQHWVADYLITPPFVSDGLVPSLRIEPALAELDALLGNETLYRQRQAEQAEAYARRSRATHDGLFSENTTATSGA